MRGKTFISWWTLVFEEVVIILDRWSVLMVKPWSWLVQTRSIGKGRLEGGIEESRLGWRKYKKHSHRTVGAGQVGANLISRPVCNTLVLSSYLATTGPMQVVVEDQVLVQGHDGQGMWVGRLEQLGLYDFWYQALTGLGNVQQGTLSDRTQTVQCNIWGNSVEAPWVQLPSARDGCHQAWYPPAVTSSLISGRQCNIWCPAYCTHFQLHITHRDRMQYTVYLGKMEDRWETYSQRHRVQFSWYQEGGGAMVPVTDDHLPSLPNGQLHR